MKIAIIPARGGSKGLPRKNLLALGGKPTIVWTLEAAMASETFDRVIVTTDDLEIAETSSTVRGVRIHDRPAELATDTATSMDVVFDVMEAEKASGEDIVVLLQPTSPLRNAEDISLAFKEFSKGGCDALVSVTEYDTKAYWVMYLEDGLLRSLASNVAGRRQELPKLFIPNGAIYISTVANLKEHRSFTVGRCRPYVMPAERSVDIDTLKDLQEAERVITG